MKILCIDTSGRTCSCAICEDERAICERTLDEGLTHSETLMPLIDALFAESGLDIRDTNVVAVVNGPGSFTGIRIGICAAKGFAQTLGIPAAEIDTLELLAKNAEGFDGLIVPMLDARRGQVYAALFENGKRFCEDMAAPVEDIVSLVGSRRAVFLGDGAEALKDKISELKPDAEFGDCNYPLAKNAAAIALHAQKTDAKGIMPNYLRESQAERKKHEREGR